MARGEVTGRKLKTDRDIPRLGFRIPEFCRAFGISQEILTNICLAFGKH
jgi:hypothetical protein